MNLNVTILANPVKRAMPVAHMSARGGEDWLAARCDALYAIENYRTIPGDCDALKQASELCQSVFYDEMDILGFFRGWFYFTDLIDILTMIIHLYYNMLCYHIRWLFSGGKVFPIHYRSKWYIYTPGAGRMGFEPMQVCNHLQPIISRSQYTRSGTSPAVLKKGVDPERGSSPFQSHYIMCSIDRTRPLPKKTPKLYDNWTEEKRNGKEQ